MNDTLSDGRIMRLESVHLTPDAWFHANAAGQLNTHFDDYDIIGKTVFDLDAVFIMSCGPFTLIPGDSTTFSFALIMGDNLNDLKLNARTAQTMYDLNYLGAEAPVPPTVTAVPGDGRATLYWDAISEESVDILTGYKDFEGYKIYRTSVHPSNNKWGDPITDGSGNAVGFVPLVQYDLANSIAGLDPVDPHLDRGSNTGLSHVFVDSTVENGVTYWYSVCAYDMGISSQNDSSLNPNNWADLNYLENAKGNNVGGVPNLAEVIPGRPPLGYVPPQAGVLFPDPDSLGKGTITALLVNPALATSSHAYTLTFDDTTQPGTLLYSVLDESQALLVDRSTATGGSDAGPVFNGVRMWVDNTPSLAYRDGRWTEVADDTSTMTVGPLVAGQQPSPSDYLLTFSEGGQPTQVSAQVYNFTLDPGLNTKLLDTLLRVLADSVTYNLAVREQRGGQARVTTWTFALTIVTRYIPLDTIIVGTDTTIRYIVRPAVMPTAGDRYLFRTNKPVTSTDVFTFSVQGSSQRTSLTSQDLNAIKVVPNPYMVTAEWETSPTQKQLAFTNLPPTCTIEVYTVTGELVRRIERQNATQGFEYWNLLNSSNRMVAYGLYVFVVTAPGGAEKIGKFVVMR